MRGNPWAFAIIFFGGLAVAVWFIFGEPMLRVSQTKDHIREKMRDPSSVQFREMEMRSLKPPLNYVVCGEFNAKNGFGAYTGFQRFYAFRGGDIRMEGKYEKFELGWVEFCHRSVLGF